MSIPYLENYNEHYGKKVYVYFNLTKKCWSVRHKGKVLFHADVVRLEGVTFKVSEAGRQRVIRERKKYVHAYAVGSLVVARLNLGHKRQGVNYNPYHAGHFTTNEGTPIFEAPSALLVGKSVIAIEQKEV